MGRWTANGVAILAGVMGLAEEVVAGNRGLSPIITKMPGADSKVGTTSAYKANLTCERTEMKLSPTHLVFAIAVGVAPAVMAGQQDSAMERAGQKARPDPVTQAQVIAQASQARQVVANAKRSIGVCFMIENPTLPAREGLNLLSPVAITRGYFNSIEHQALEGASKVTVLQPPVHGTLEDLGTFVRDGFNGPLKDSGERNYRYSAKAGYVGQDSVTLLVEKGGYKITVTFFLHVLKAPIGNDAILIEELCPNGEPLWRISSEKALGQVLSFALIGASRPLR
jgi:hypothetical protein